MTLNMHLTLPDINDDVTDTLKALHWQMKSLEHNVHWFIDGNGLVRLLVSIVTEWHIQVYYAGDDLHVERVPIARRSADLTLDPVQVSSFGITGLLRYIEEQLDVSLERNYLDGTTALPSNGRVA